VNICSNLPIRRSSGVPGRGVEGAAAANDMTALMPNATASFFIPDDVFMIDTP
jgi:hypothetical protein